MKKMFIALVLMLTFGGYSFAQTTPAKAKKTTTTTAAKSTTKKDGTADMRYKANKDAAKAKTATTHTKKDGTADKRFKENKKK
ncbi:MAG: hypothetical protein ACHQDF_02500 [Chitinophagales bacterium]